MYFFPSGSNSFGKKVQDCSVSFTDATGNILNPQMSLRHFVKERGLYVSQTYFILHSKFTTNSALLDLINCFDNEPFDGQLEHHESFIEYTNGGPANSVNRLGTFQQLYH